MRTSEASADPGTVRPDPDRPRDGRDARWEQHRTLRRRQLVESTLRAIREHGPAVGMDDIAARAGTSKTVLYRHFGDRLGIWRAVVEAVDELILADLESAAAEGDPVDRIAAMVTAYLRLVERDPDIYRFVISRPIEAAEDGPDPVGRLTGAIGLRIADVLAGSGHPEATLWGHGIVGLVRASAEHWLVEGMPAGVDELTAAVMTLIAPALRRPEGTDPSPTDPKESR